MKKLFLFLLLAPSTGFCSLESINRSLETYGDTAQIALPAIAMSYALYEKDYKGAGYFAETFAAAQSFTLLLKQTDEERPGKTETGNGFPSGHTMAAFTGASFLDRRYDIKGKYYFYAAAGMVGVSRVAAVKHFVHDVIAGALIGIYSNKIFVKKLEKKDISLIPCIANKRVYIYSSIKF
ncbi:MAG: phosphatase PAP2 family protein [Elusimicrobiota bacterium]